MDFTGRPFMSTNAALVCNNSLFPHLHPSIPIYLEWNKKAVAEDGFIAWWILQHVSGYKHLETKIINNESFSSTLKGK